jgi:citrate/tricarballylate utilization protein
VINDEHENRSREGAIRQPHAKDAIPTVLIQEGERVLRLCNACRYCEGYCAVFPALERRTAFSEQDLHYLANLCHNCGDCYSACPFTPPHEFALNLPRTLAEIRLATYQQYAWPGIFGIFLRRSGLAAAAALVVVPLLFLGAMLVWIAPTTFFSAHTDAEGAFYAVLSRAAMTFAFGLVSLGVIAAFTMEMVRYWRDIRPASAETGGMLWNPAAFSEAVGDSLRMKYLEGGGEGCASGNEVKSHARRWFHHLTFYGFVLCFAATTVAAIYHYLLGREAPYPFLSAPVLLGTAGGAGLLAGPLGLLWLKRKRNSELTDPKQAGIDGAFLALLFLTSLTGFLLLALRETAAMGIALAVHLGLVMGLFVSMPYGKFVHATYRFAALARNAMEKRRPLPGGGAESILH